MNKKIPVPAITRLCKVYKLLGDLYLSGRKRVSSSEIGGLLGSGAHNIRKDINYIGEIGNTGSGYGVSVLKEHICRELNLKKPRNVCVAGLGRIGSAVLEYKGFKKKGYSIVAGFDSDVNRLDTIRTSVQVFPAHEITDVVRNKKIELAVLAVPAEAANDIAQRLINGGVKGIVNFTPAIIIKKRDNVHIINMDLVTEFTLLSARISIDESGNWCGVL